MSRLAFVDRVKSWFGASRAHLRATAGPDERWPLGRASGELALAGVGAGDPSGDDLDLPDMAAVAVATAVKALPRPVAQRVPPPAPPTERGDPQWLDRLESLPDRIAEAVARSASGAQSLAKVAAELQGHRETERGVAEAIAELPGLARERSSLIAETNHLLEQQNRLTETMIDGITGLRAALRSMDESSLRHLACIEQLEAVHRQVLDVYQTTLLKAHRRLGRLSLFAVALSIAALAAVAVMIHLSFGG